MYTFKSLEFVGYNDMNKNVEFGLSDNKTKFEENLKKLGPSWEFANHKIKYERNNFGHRDKEHTLLDTDNFVLFSGCSITEGMGLSVNQRYSEVLSKLLNCDSYNMGLSSTGPDIVFYNLLLWLIKLEIKPKLIIIQWPTNNRFLTANFSNLNLIKTNGVWDEKIHDFLVMGENIGYFNSKQYMLSKLLNLITDIPIIEFYVGDSVTYVLNSTHRLNLGHLIVDQARDRMHPGPRSHQNWAETLYSYIKEKNLFY